jgi:hypothetical protein
MGGLMGGGTSMPPMPKPQKPAPMPDPEDPQVLAEERRQLAEMLSRGGRKSTIIGDHLASGRVNPDGRGDGSRGGGVNGRRHGGPPPVGGGNTGLRGTGIGGGVSGYYKRKLGL